MDWTKKVGRKQVGRKLGAGLRRLHSIDTTDVLLFIHLWHLLGIMNHIIHDLSIWKKHVWTCTIQIKKPITVEKHKLVTWMVQKLNSENSSF